MKKIIPLLLSLIMLSSLSAQVNINRGRLSHLTKQERWQVLHNSRFGNYTSQELLNKNNTTESLNVLEEQSWNGTSWDEEYRMYFYYNTSSNLLEYSISEYYDNGVWHKDSKSDFGFNQAGQLILDTYSYWNEDSKEYQLDFKEEFTYSNGLLITEAEFVWDEDASDWRYYSLVEYTYLEGTLLTKRSLSDENNDGVLIPYSKIEYEYDEFYNLIQANEYRFSPDTTSSQWDETNRYFYEYENGDLSNIVTEYFNGFEFEKQDKVSMEFSNDVLISANTYRFDSENDMFEAIPHSENEFELDGLGNPTSSYGDNEYEIFSQTYTYNTSNPFSTVIAPPKNWFGPNYYSGVSNYEYSFSDKIVSSPTEETYTYTEKQSGDESKSRTLYTYGIGGVGISNYKNEFTVRLFPNPASDKIYIETPKSGIFTLYDSVGKKVLIESVFDSRITSINISTLPNGYYTYQLKLETGEIAKTNKLIKH